jgi:hypothetical protein
MPTPDKAVDSVVEHWYLWLFGLGGLAMFVWKVVQFVFWSEQRVEHIATKVLSSEAVKDSVKDIAKGVFETLHRENTDRLIRLEEQFKLLDHQNERILKILIEGKINDE